LRINRKELSRPELIVFDIDGTLIKWKGYEYIWQFLLRDLKLEKANQEYLRRYNSKKISYYDWHKRLFSLMASNDIKYKDFYYSICNALPDTTLIYQLILRLKQHVRYMAILSGSITLALEIGQIPMILFDVIYAHL